MSDILIRESPTGKTLFPTHHIEPYNKTYSRKLMYICR